MSERIVNLCDYQVICRDGKRSRVHELPDDVTRIDRLTRWGNPFKIGDRCGHTLYEPMDRAEVIRHYRDWLKDRLTEDPNFLRPLRGMRLACWCAPLPCHGDVITELIP